QPAQLDLSHRRAGLLRREGAEVVAAYQVAAGTAHGSLVDLREDSQDPVAVHCQTAGVAVHLSHAEDVTPVHAVELHMEGQCARHDLDDPHVVREMSVERQPQLLVGELRGGIDLGHHGESMYPGVSPTSSQHAAMLPRQPADGAFENSLYGALALRLTLPAV